MKLLYSTICLSARHTRFSPVSVFKRSVGRNDLVLAGFCIRSSKEHLNELMLLWCSAENEALMRNWYRRKGFGKFSLRSCWKTTFVTMTLHQQWRGIEVRSHRLRKMFRVYQLPIPITLSIWTAKATGIFQTWKRQKSGWSIQSCRPNLQGYKRRVVVSTLWLCLQ